MEAPPPRRLTVEAGGAALEVLAWEAVAPAVDQPVVVFLHEGLGAAGLWRDLPGQVAAATGCRAYAYSRRGYGRSARRDGAYTPAYMHDEARDVLPAVLAALGSSRSILVGHSDGASIALLHAAARPVEGLALLAPHVFVEDLTVASITATRDRFLTTDLPDRLARHHDDPSGAFWGWNDVWLSPAFRSWDITACLPDVRCPVLVLQGADDEYGTLAQVSAIADRVAGPCEVRVLDGCGHSPQRDRPAETLDALVAFVRRVANPHRETG